MAGPRLPRRVAVLGGGVEGAATARWLLAQGADVEIRDRDEVALPDGASGTFGDAYLQGLDRFELVIRSPGVPFLTPEVQEAARSGVVVSSHTRLFFERCPVPIIGVTGTKGKGTVATLLRDMLQAGGKAVHLGGNIGVPPLEFLDRIQPDDTVILELSSFQLQDLDRSPRTAIITNLGEDHLDHHRDLGEYHAAKLNVLAHQRQGDAAILNAESPKLREAEALGRGAKYWFTAGEPRLPGGYLEDDTVTVDIGDGPEPIVAREDSPLVGPHNAQNVLAAAIAARLQGTGAETIEQAVIDYSPLPYHLELVGERQGVRFVNDSYSTTPTSTIPAMSSFPDTPLVLIVGGHDKGADYADLAKHILQRRTKALLLIGAAGKRIEQAVLKAHQAGSPGALPATIEMLEHKGQIVPRAAELAGEGDVVLFSPGAASFGWFDSYAERGKYFSEQVRSL